MYDHVYLYIYLFIYLSTYSCLSNLYFYSYELSLTDEWFSSEHVVANKHTQVFCLSFSSFNVFKQYLSKTCVYRKSIYLCIMKQSSMLFRLSSGSDLCERWWNFQARRRRPRCDHWSLQWLQHEASFFRWDLYEVSWRSHENYLVVSLSYPLSKQTI